MLSTILIVDDDPIHAELLDRIVRRMGYATQVLSNGLSALEALTGPDARRIDAVLLDLVMPDLDGMAVLNRLRGAGNAVPVITMVTPSGVDSVMSSIKAGANDFAVKPVSPERLAVALMNALRLSSLKSGLMTDRSKRSDTVTLATLFEDDPLFLRLSERATKAAQSHLPLLIEGEEGTGKTLLARAIHGSSMRCGKPFVRFDALGSHDGEAAGALNSALIAARGGTLLIESADRLSALAQERLASWDGWSSQPGATPRLMLTTRVALVDEVRSGRFREDLFYRISVMPMALRPLRERPDDLPKMAERILLRRAHETGKDLRGLSLEAIAWIKQHSWLGNYPEFEATLTISVARASGVWVSASDLESIGAGLAHPTEGSDDTPPHAISLLDDFGALRSFAAIEADILTFARDYCQGSLGRAAELLGLGRSTLYRKFKDTGAPEQTDWPRLGDAA